MDTGFLDFLAKQLMARHSPACRRAISRILTTVEERFRAGEYNDEAAAERDLRSRIAAEPACREARVDA